MRCLYCGKELALLKRLRGGGEFCSDAHRQQYQEEYNQLALNRLLQAKPATEESAPETPQAAPPAASSKVVEESNRLDASRRAGTLGLLDPEPMPAAVHASERRVAEPVIAAPVARANDRPAPAAEVVAPAPPAGFLLEVPTVAEVALVQCHVELEHLRALAPALPERDLEWNPEAGEGIPSLAGQVELLSIRAAAELPISARARNIESREFSRPVQPLDKLLVPLADSRLPSAKESLELTIAPSPLTAPGIPWLAPEREFVPAGISLGELARLEFGTIGFLDDPNPIKPRPIQEYDASPLAEPEPLSTAPEAPLPARRASIESASAVEPAAAYASGREEATTVPAPKEPVSPALGPPKRFEPAKIQPLAGRIAEVKAQPIFRDKSSAPKPPASGLKAIEPKEELKQAKPETRHGPPPKRVTAPVTVEVKPAAAVRGRTVQVFSSPMAPAAEVQIPRSGAMPLRQVMVFGPAADQAALEAHAKEEPKTDEPRKDSPSNRQASPRGKVEVRQPAKPAVPEKPAAEQKAVPPKAQDSPRPQPDKSKTVVRPRPDPKSPVVSIRPSAARIEADPSRQAPEAAADASRAQREIPTSPVSESKPAVESPKLEAAALRSEPPAEVDLGLPTLHLETRDGFVARLSIGAKIGLALGLAVLLGGVAYMVMYGNNVKATPPPAPREIVQLGTPLRDAVWVADWLPDSNRRGRRITLLKSNLPLTDYRIQFEAQIESKAIGWVYRAKDQQNYYVAKLEVIKPGLEPVVALVRFAVINGEDQERSTTPLRQKVRVDTLYKIRMDVIGDKFAAWVGDEKVVEWTDDKLASGPPGLLNEKNESAVMKGSMNVLPLVVRKQ
jgi:hypothetical protein